MTQSFIERIAQLISTTSDHKLVYGEAVKHQGILIIPVAKISYGFGGGYGHEGIKSGCGAGGGVFATPIGYIVIDQKGKSEFKRIKPAISIPTLIISVSISSYLVLKILKHLFR